MALQLSRWKGNPSHIEYEGVELEIWPLNAVESQWITKLNGIRQNQDWDSLSPELQDAYSGVALVGTVLTKIGYFEIPAEGPGEMDVEFHFDSPSTDPRFENMAEELLFQDEMLRGFVMSHALNMANFRDLKARNTEKKS